MSSGLSVDSHFCTACQATISGSEYKTHYSKSDWHRYNVKRRVAGLPSISQLLFESQLAALQEKRSVGEKNKIQLNCNICGKQFQSQSAYQSHLTSNKHVKKAEMKKKGKSEGEAAAMADGDEAAEADGESGEEKVSESTAEQKMAELTISPKPSAGGEEKKDEKSDSEDDGAAGAEGFDDWDDAAAIKLLHCLFCRETHADQQSSVDHMLKEHGFFVPFVEYLVNLDGLLTYLGEKIGIGRVCLWCNGRGRARFPSIQAVQQHMKHKSHCKLRLDTPEEEEEFMDFYEFPKTEEEEEEERIEKEKKEAAERRKKNPYALPGDKAAATKPQTKEIVAMETTSAQPAADEKPKRRLAGMTENGELLLTDGSLVGHRQYKSVYRQNYKPGPQKESQIIALMASYNNRNAVVAQTGSGASKGLQTNTKKDAPAGFREAWWHHERRKNHLKVGMSGNIQMHYRAQVQF